LCRFALCPYYQKKRNSYNIDLLSYTVNYPLKSPPLYHSLWLRLSGRSLHIIDCLKMPPQTFNKIVLFTVCSRFYFTICSEFIDIIERCKSNVLRFVIPARPEFFCGKDSRQAGVTGNRSLIMQESINE